METLGQKQRRFAGYVARLIFEAEARGYECALGEASRAPAQAVLNSMGKTGRQQVANYLAGAFPDLARAILNITGNGIAASLHPLGIALDLKLFRDGVYLTTDVDYRELGGWWKTLAPDCRWGGDFPGDGNHFSIEHNGVK